MKTKTLTILLAVSVAFNIFFAIGYFKARKYIKLTQTFAGRSELIAEKLNLTPQQKTEYLVLRKQFSEKRRKRRRENQEQYDKFWKEIVKDEPDQKFLEEFIQTASPARNRRNFVERMQALMKILNPEQRELAVAMIKTRFQKRTRNPQAEAPHAATQ